MSRFVEHVPDRARSATYLLAVLVVVEIVASTIGTIAIGTLFLLEGLAANALDPWSFLTGIGALFAGFQVNVLEIMAVDYYLRTGDLLILAVVTTFYVVSFVVVGYLLRRTGWKTRADVDQYLEARSS